MTGTIFIELLGDIFVQSVWQGIIWELVKFNCINTNLIIKSSLTMTKYLFLLYTMILFGITIKNMKDI